MDWFDDQFSKLSDTVPSLVPPTRDASLKLNLPIRVSVDLGYELQTSTDLEHWEVRWFFVSAGGQVKWIEAVDPAVPHRFYRLVDLGASTPAPTNDAFAKRTPLTGLPVTVTGYNNGASRELGEPVIDAAAQSAGRTVWYEWTAPATGRTTVSVEAYGALVPLVGIYRGSTLGTLQLLATGLEMGRFDAVSGTNYQILVDGSSGGATGGFEMSVRQSP